MTKKKSKLLDEEIVEEYGENIRGLKNIKAEKPLSNKNDLYETSLLRNKPNSKKTPKKVRVSRLKKERVAARLAEIDELFQKENRFLTEYGEKRYHDIKNKFKTTKTVFTEAPKKVLSSRVKHEDNHTFAHVGTVLDLAALIK